MNAAVFEIGEIARAYDLTLRTLRFWEARGLLAPRRSGQTRLYSEADRERVGVIVRLAEQGWSLREIRARLDGRMPTRAEIDAQLAHLRAE